jgi:hypothetical protein
MMKIVRGIIGVVVGLFVAGALLGTSLTAISNADLYVGVNPAVVIVATVLIPILGCVAIALYFFPEDL